MSNLIARENDIVTCVAKNHPMFRVARDIERGERIKAIQLEALHPKTPQPVSGERTPTCRICRSGFMSHSAVNLGVFLGVMRTVRVHFEDGYH